MSSHHSSTLDPKTRDLLNVEFGQLIVIAFAGYRPSGKQRIAYWQCRCLCGTVKDMAANTLLRGAISCGCLNASLARIANTTHGATVNRRVMPEYNIWTSMIDRCENPKSSVYHDYGGRGITICVEWRHSFATFLADIGARPHAGLSIDRIDNDQGYSKENCRWATPIEQSRNTRWNVLLTWDGRTQCVTSWAEELNMSVHTLYGRIYTRGWSIERALTTPVRPKRPNGTGRTPKPPTAD